MASAEITCTRAYIGQAPTITIKPIVSLGDIPNSFKLYYEFGSQSGTIIERTTNKVINSFVLPQSFYYEMPDRLSYTGVLYCDCYVNGMYKDTATTTFTADVNANNNKPTISIPRVTDTNSVTTALTGDNSKLIRYASRAYVVSTVRALNGAWLQEIQIQNGGQYKSVTGLDESYTTSEYFDGVDSRTFAVRAADSRGLTTSISYSVPSDRFIEYVKLTCNTGNDKPDTDGRMRLTCSGNYFNGSFGAANNTLRVQYRWKALNGGAITWTDFPADDVSISGNTYSADVDLTGFNYRDTYVFECRAIDAIMTATTDEHTAQALPVFHWSKDEFVHETPVDFRAGIMVNGNESDIIVDQGETDIWQYRKWQSGRAECWGFISKTIAASAWYPWENLYDAEIVIGYPYPFAFTETPLEFASLSGTGGMLESMWLGMSATTTGGYFVVRPNKLSSNYDYLLYLYVVGRWK